MQLEDLGWNDFFQDQFRHVAKDSWIPARIIQEQKNHYRVQSETGEGIAELSGRFVFETVGGRADLPVVGDWVAVRRRDGEGRCIIQYRFRRKSRFVRKSSGRSAEEQVIAANIDTLFLVTTLGRDFNPRRMERYLALAWEGGAAPVLLFNKSDLCRDPSRQLEIVRSLAGCTPSHVISARTGEGTGELDRYLQHGTTVALLGSSGVGKSTLINRLAGSAIQPVNAVRESDGRGRHTTTSRQLIRLPSGAALIDTPGLRELQLIEASSGLEQTFSEIEILKTGCHFSDCSHDHEPGCAVRAALDRGLLDEDRHASYLKLRREIQYHNRKADKRLELEEKRRWKIIHKDYRRHFRDR